MGDFITGNSSKPKNYMAGVMAGVVLYVEYRSGHDDRTDGIRTVLEGIGVKVNPRLYK